LPALYGADRPADAGGALPDAADGSAAGAGPPSGTRQAARTGAPYAPVHHRGGRSRSLPV